jgi:uncharacterized membrane protein YjfL (UPF0719 family)
MDRSFLEAFGLTVAVCVVYAGLLRVAQGFLRRGRATFSDENPAHRLYAALQAAGVLWIGASVAHQCAVGEDLARDALWAFAFGGVGFVLYLVAGQLGVRLLFGARLADEIDEGNVAAALAAGAHHIAVAILVAESAAGTDLFGLGLASGFFLLGLMCQQLVVVLHRAMTTYDDAEQIAGENMAAALSWSGTSIAAAIVIARALSGEFQGWDVALPGFLQVAALALLLLPFRQVVVGGLLLGTMPRLRGGILDDAVGLKHDAAVAALDAAVAIAVAFAIARLA